MEATVHWELFLALIEPVYHKPFSKGGPPPFPLEVMLRIHLLQMHGGNCLDVSVRTAVSEWEGNIYSVSSHWRV